MYDDRYGYPGRFEISLCRNCGHRSIKNKFSPEVLTLLYSNYYPRSAFDIGDYHPAREVKGFRSWLNGETRYAYSWVPKKVRVLDIGCGFGETLGYHRSRGCEVYGVEADGNIRRVADTFGFRVHIGLFNPDLYEENFFDYVTMDQVIEHVTDPLFTMKGIARILKPGGSLIVSTPNSNGWGAKLFGRRWINWHAPYHLQHFSIGSMAICAEKTGLIIERVKTITSSHWLYWQWLHLLTFPDPGIPSQFWSPGGHEAKSPVGKGLRGAFMLIHRLKINHIVTRFFDSLGIGDNHLFFLRKP